MNKAEHESDPFENLRTAIDKAVRRIKKHTPSFDIDKVPLTDPKVMRAMVSSAFGQDGREDSGASGKLRTWSPFAHKHQRKILRLLSIKTPCFEDFMHLYAVMLSGYTYGSGLLNEYVARRSGADTADIVSFTKTTDGASRLYLFPAPRKSGWGRIKPAPATLKPFLSSTFGLVLFLDQVETICAQIAGFNKRQTHDLYGALWIPGFLGGEYRKEWVMRFIKASKHRGLSEAESEGILKYLCRSRYSYPLNTSDYVREYVRYSYLHAFLWLYHPHAYAG